jgi:hypothetical protein
MKYVKKFEKFIQESTITAPQPAVEPGIAPPITKPKKPVKPSKPIIRPNVDPDPKAKKKKTTEMDVAKRFIEEVNAKGESVEKYLNK